MMNGWLEDGSPAELTQEQERIVNGIIQWSLDGTPFTLPAMGQQSGKSVITSTVAHYFSQLSHGGKARERLVTQADAAWIRRKI